MSTRLSTEELDAEMEAAEARRPAVWRYRDVKDGKAERWTYSYGEPRHLPDLGFGRTWEVQPLYTSPPVADEVSDSAARRALRDLTDALDENWLDGRNQIGPIHPALAAARAVLSENPDTP